MAKVAKGMLLSDGTFPAVAWPSGYPLYYLIERGKYPVCPPCADRIRVKEGIEAVESYDIHWEGEPLVCGICGDAIESAYGVPKES